MDNDDLRRGEPTNHVKFGAGMATLAGDGLLTLAFQWLTDNQLPVDVQANLTLALAKAAGPSGMVAGQARDIEGEGQHLKLTELQYLHRQKREHCSNTRFRQVASSLSSRLQSLTF